MTTPTWYADAISCAGWMQRLGRFFVVGCQKSGTTWMQLLCNAHPRLACRGEGHFSDVLVPLLTQAYETYNAQGKANHKLPPDDLLAACRLLIDRSLHRYLPDSEPARDRLVAVGDKTPEGAVGLGVLDRLFPGARYVHVVRDGRDCVVSGLAHLRRMGQHERFADTAEYARFFAETHWVPYVTLARQTGAPLAGRYLEVRYEDMLRSPHEHAARVFSFLGVEADGATVSRAVERTTFERLSGGRARGQADGSSHYRKGVAGDWRGALEPGAVEAFESVAGGLLRELGYPLGGLRAAG